MSSRDIDSTSENVLHDWARDEPDEASSERAEAVGEDSELEDRTPPAWGTASVASEPVHEVAATVVETEPEVPEAEPQPDEAGGPDDADAASEPLDELAEGEILIDETPMQVELSHEHAAGDLHIPDGYAVLEGVAEGGRRAVGVVVSRFNGSVTTELLDGALAELAAAGVRQEAITIMVVPGAFELPLAATALAKTRRFACIVALGCVIRGDTPHFDYVSSEAASGLQLAALETGVPVSFGVLTLDRVEQAEPRIGKGAEAVRSALEMADLFAHLRAAAASR
jgi:6,7-dimethyl-8-ribityllumazine synthase